MAGHDSTTACITQWMAFLAVGVVLLCRVGCTQAQVPRSDSGDTRLMQQVQQLVAERASLQAENAQLKQQVQQLTEQLTKKSGSADQQQRVLQQKLQALQQSADRSNAAEQQDSAALAKLRMQLQELIGHYRDTVGTMRQIELDRNALRAKLAASDDQFRACVDRNANLYLTASQILQKYDQHGFWGCVADKEPFTQISRVRLDNLADAYKQRIDELQQGQAKTGGGGP